LEIARENYIILDSFAFSRLIHIEPGAAPRLSPGDA
jgi:hypothetical protein